MKHCSKHVGMTAFKPNAYLQELTAAAVFTVKRLKQAICFEDIWCRTKISVPCFLFFFFFFCTPYFSSLQTIFFSKESQFCCHGNLHFHGQFPRLYTSPNNSVKNLWARLLTSACSLLSLTQDSVLGNVQEHLHLRSAHWSLCYQPLRLIFKICVLSLLSLPFTMGQFILAKILGWARDTAFTLCHPRTDTSNPHLGCGVGLRAAHIPLYFVCCLEYRAIIWRYSRQMIHLAR